MGDIKQTGRLETDATHQAVLSEAYRWRPNRALGSLQVLIAQTESCQLRLSPWSTPSSVDKPESLAGFPKSPSFPRR